VFTSHGRKYLQQPGRPRRDRPRPGYSRERSFTRGINIYTLSGELVGHLANAQGADKLLDKVTDKLFPASCFPAPNSLVCVYSQAKGKLTFARSRRDRFFGNRVRPNCTAQGRQQTVGADEAEGLAWVQVRWDGQRHQTVGW
jgi:hypothetical protein